MLDSLTSTGVLTPMIEITEAVRIPSEGVLDGQSLDTPAAPSAHDTYVVPIGGWVHSGVSAARRVEILSEGHRLSSSAVRLPRRDVAKHLAVEGEVPLGFMGEVNLLELPRQFELTLCAELDDGRSVPFMAIRGSRQPLGSSFEPTLQPIFVTNIGRCGSTVLMNLLRSHPRIVVHDLYPYETRSLSYWIHMLKVLSGPADHENSAHPNSYEDQLSWVGQHPHNMWPVTDPPAVRNYLRRDYVDNLAEFAQRCTEGFYHAVREAQEVEEPVYFAEKRNPRPGARIASELYPDSREIFLVREPRDMVCSMISFYEKTRLVAFGRDRSGSDQEFINGISHGLRNLVNQMNERRDNAMLVRYEDLLVDMPGTLERILGYLDLPSSAEVRSSMVSRTLEATASSQRHRTTASVGDSIGRWRRDLDDRMQELCTTAFADLIPELGYEL